MNKKHLLKGILLLLGILFITISVVITLIDAQGLLDYPKRPSDALLTPRIDVFGLNIGLRMLDYLLIGIFITTVSVFLSFGKRMFSEVDVIRRKAETGKKIITKDEMERAKEGQGPVKLGKCPKCARTFPDSSAGILVDYAFHPPKIIKICPYPDCYASLSEKTKETEEKPIPVLTPDQGRVPKEGTVISLTSKEETVQKGAMKTYKIILNSRNIKNVLTLLQQLGISPQVTATKEGNELEIMFLSEIDIHLEKLQKTGEIKSFTIDGLPLQNLT